MTDLYVIRLVTIYGVTAAAVASSLIAIRRASRRNRASREMVTRLWRWRNS